MYRMVFAQDGSVRQDVSLFGFYLPYCLTLNINYRTFEKGYSMQKCHSGIDSIAGGEISG